jgi:tetratricopeptide (TPR) repeat protein
MLRFGRREEALDMFARARSAGGDELELLLSMGRALYREKMYEEAHRVFDEAATVHGDSPEAAAALGYTLHRLGDESGARRQLRRALLLDARHHEARVYLGHMLYDRSDWAGALREFERIGAAEHWDQLAVCRVIELKRALEGTERGSPPLSLWEARLVELEMGGDAVDALLAEVEATVANDPKGYPESSHRVVLPGGQIVTGTWLEIVLQLRDLNGGTTESVAEYMRRRSREESRLNGIALPSEDAASFVIAGERAGLWRIEG